MLRQAQDTVEFWATPRGKIIAVKLDIWLATFAAGMLIASGSSYRERALLPFEGEGDTGFLGREVGESGLTNLVSLDEQNLSRFIPGLIRRGNGAVGSFRRNIAPRGSGGPLTSSPSRDQIASGNQGPSGNGSGSSAQPGFVDNGVLNGGNAGGAGTAPTGNIGGGSPGFGNLGGSPITTVGLLDPNDTTPTTPGTPGVVVPPVISPVPEPGIWMLFLVGLFASGAVLRRQKRQPVAVHQ